MTKNIIFKLGTFKIYRRFGSNVLSFSIGNMHLFLINRILSGIGQIGKYKAWDFSLDMHGENSLTFTSYIGRYAAHTLWFLEFSIFNLIYFQFDFYDTREWNYYTGKRVYISTEEEYNQLLGNPNNKKPVYKERKKKAKWYYNSQFLKVYNFDFLNNPWGLTIDWAWFPTLFYTKFSFGVDKKYWFNINFDLNKEQNNGTTGLTLKTNISLFSRFIEFEIGQNTVLREANLYHAEDFLTLINHGADPNMQDEYGFNILSKQVEHKNLAFLWYAFKYVDLAKINTDNVLQEISYSWNYRQEIFEYVLSKINYVKNWEEIENLKDDFEPVAYQKLLALKDNSIPIAEEQITCKPKLFNCGCDLFAGHGELVHFFIKLFNTYLKFDIRHLGETEFEHNFKLNFSRDFGISNYILADFSKEGMTSEKCIAFKFLHNNVRQLGINITFLGIWQTFWIGSLTEDICYNYKKQQLVSIEEDILIHQFNKKIDMEIQNKRGKKYKEFYNSKYIKIYNSNYLNKPYGRSIEIYLPFNHYLKFSFNRLHQNELKNETNCGFTWLIDDTQHQNKHFAVGFSMFNHYFKIVLSPNTPARFSIVHSDKSLAKFKNKSLDNRTINNLFKETMNPKETWIYKKVVESGIDLSNLDFDELIYNLAFRPYYNSNTLGYMLQVAKENNVRLTFQNSIFLPEEEKATKQVTNNEIIEYLKTDTGNDFTESALNQLIKYVDQQEDMQTAQ